MNSVYNHKMIWVRFEREGIHKYSQALTDPQLADVSFLGYPHRHMFKFEVAIEVFHDDREIEFILFKREIEQLYKQSVLDLDDKSCEMIADQLYGYLRAKYAGRDIEINVSEDGENGCRCFYPK